MLISMSHPREWIGKFILHFSKLLPVTTISFAYGAKARSTSKPIDFGLAPVIITVVDEGG